MRQNFRQHILLHKYTPNPPYVAGSVWSYVARVDYEKANISTKVGCITIKLGAHIQVPLSQNFRLPENLTKLIFPLASAYFVLCAKLTLSCYTNKVNIIFAYHQHISIIIMSM